MGVPYQTGPLDLDQPLWRTRIDNEPVATESEVKIHYDRARSICRDVGTYSSFKLSVLFSRYLGMTAKDVLSLRPKFWEFHSNRESYSSSPGEKADILPALSTRDSAAVTILTIHWNLCMGTIATHAVTRPDLQILLRELEQFDICGEFMLTEVGHGLDARNLKTIANMQPDGSFILHTPSPEAAKVMPPTTPYAGVARVAIVFAQLIVEGENRGIKPFLVRINEIGHMCEGVSSKILPQRSGAKPVDHAVTTFKHVYLAPGALLGEPEGADDPRLDFFMSIWRVGVGTLSLSMINIPCLNVGAHIVARYSQRRQIGNEKNGQKVRIFDFKTVQLPVLSALAHGHVFEKYARWSTKAFMSPKESDWRVKHAIACAFKAATTASTQAILSELIDRCGWQGLFGYNQLSELMLALRGNSIAEGDVLVLCIR